jgi:hypothetical protein
MSKTVVSLACAAFALVLMAWASVAMASASVGCGLVLGAPVAHQSLETAPRAAATTLPRTPAQEIAAPPGAGTTGGAAEAAAKSTASESLAASGAAAAAVPAFRSSIREIPGAVKIRMLESGSWKKGDPITFSQLRLIEVTYWGFDDQAHTGRLVVNAQWAARLCTVFQKLYEARFPIRSMNLIDDYAASDRKSMNADNTSCYNGRLRGGSTTVWSMHAYGLAIDINPVENPWVYSSGYSPDAGRAYLSRSLEAPGMIHAGDVVVKAFASIGWVWGGSWSSSKDYQHFSSNGQ